MDLNLNAKRFTGSDYISTYHHFRPEPPKEIITKALDYLGRKENINIVDLGCGTGISSTVWEANSHTIHAFDPSEEMIAFAKSNNISSKINYEVAFAHDLPISTDSIDIITCSQSFHWMDPDPTLKEADRILKKGGVFLVYDAFWPPIVNEKYEKAYKELFNSVDQLTDELDQNIAFRWDKGKHFENISNSGHFTSVEELSFNRTEACTKDKLLGIALSQGGLEALLKRGFTKEQIGIDKFESVIDQMDEKPEIMTFRYKAIYAVKS